jgi:hypothetical protein
MFGIFDIFKNNYDRLNDLRSELSAELVAGIVNTRLQKLGINETVTGEEIDAFLKITRLGADRALVDHKVYNAAMRFSHVVEKSDLDLPEPH